MESITKEDWDNIHRLLEEYYLEHSKLVNRLLDKLPNREDTQGQFLMMCNERNSVYGRDDEAK
jgi:hypothetical protein